MRTLVQTCLPIVAALLWAPNAHATAAPPRTKVDRVRVAALADSFTVFFREDSRRVQSVDVARSGPVQTLAPTTCTIGSVPKELPNEIGYDVLAGESDYTILFSGVSLGTVHRGTAASAQACAGAPEPNFQPHAPGVRLSQTPKESNSVLLHATSLGNFATYVDIKREDGSHSVIASRHQTSQPGIARPAFVGGKTALLAYAVGSSLWVQTFDTEKGVAIDANAKELATDLEQETAVLAYPESVDGDFRMLYTRAPRGNELPGIYEGHLRGGVFTQVQVAGVDGSLRDGTLETTATGELQQVLVTGGRSQKGSFARLAIVGDAAKILIQSESLGDIGTETSVGCRAQTCLIATSLESQSIQLTRIVNDKVESLPSIPVTIPPYTGRPRDPNVVKQEEPVDAETGGSGCNVHAHRGRATTWLTGIALGGVLLLARRRRTR